MGYPQQQMGRPPGGGNMFVTPGIQMNPLERTAVMLMRLIAWIALILVIISACTQGIGVLLSMGDAGNQGFRLLLSNGGALAGQIVSQIWGPAFLFGVAAIVESLAAWRNKP
jgi:hypothetical protein